MRKISLSRTKKLYHFQDKHKSVHMIANDMFRARQVETLKEWFNKNYNCFEP